MTKFYVDAQGNYIGGFDGAPAPDGAIEVPSAPYHAADIWNGGGWDVGARGLPPPSVTPLEFLERFTPQERNAIRVAAKQNADLEDWLDLLRAATLVVLTDPRTVAGLEAFVAAGILTEPRKDEILT